MTKKKAQPKTSPKLALALLLLAVATLGLAIYQWVELAALRSGGRPACSINETFNCESVWNAPLADAVYGVTGVPVAGLGLVWALAAALVSLLLYRRVRAVGDTGPWVFGVRLLGLAAVVAILVFGAESARVGAICLTCLGTYALSGSFAIAAWFVSDHELKPTPFELREGLKWTVGAVFLSYVVALAISVTAPTRNLSQAELLASTTRQASSSSSSSSTSRAAASSTSVATTEVEKKLEAYLRGLGPDQQQILSDLLNEYRMGARKGSHPPPRVRWGAADAPMQLVEFTDIRCGHCGNLSATLQVLKTVAPPGALSIEPRYYPLDSECNAGMRGTDGTKVRCLGAKVQICLEQAPDFWTLREKLFEQQGALTTPEKVMEIAAAGTTTAQQLQACVNSPETAQKLAADIAFAESQGITGTPLVLVNGKQVPPVGPLLYVLALTGGNADAPVLGLLPRPRPVDHAGHSH